MNDCLCYTLSWPSFGNSRQPGRVRRPPSGPQSARGHSILGLEAISELTLMAEPAWQELLRLRLAERNAKESSFSPVIEQCTCMSCPFSFSLLKHRLFPDTSRSSAGTTNKTFEGEKRFIAACSGNC
jgi:hypothetical protein